MSVILQSCINCTTAHLSVEDLLRMAFVCDGNGNAYIRNHPSTIASFCGLIGDYTPEDRDFDGVTYTGIEIAHGLGKTTGLFLAVTDNESKTVAATAFILDADTIFLVLDGLTDGGFCVS